MDGSLLSMAQLRSAALDPGWADQRLSVTCLLLDLAEPMASGNRDLAYLQRWLAAQPVPTVGLVRELGGGGLASCVDLIVATTEELEEVAAAIEINPQASAVLVQVLRSTASLDPLQALAVESLGYATLQAGAEFDAWLTERRRSKEARTVTMKDDMVLLEREGDRLHIVLNSPETRNSLSAAMRDALTEAFRLVAMDPDIRAVEVSGNGPSFSAGGDLEEFGLLENPSEAHRVRLLRMPARDLAPHADRYRFHLHGACIGAGIELPAFAGHLAAAPGTFFQLPEIGMGLIPGAGGCVSIPRRIGRQRTAFMAITNRRIGAEQALAWGLIDEIEA